MMSLPIEPTFTWIIDGKTYCTWKFEHKGAVTLSELTSYKQQLAIAKYRVSLFVIDAVANPDDPDVPNLEFHIAGYRLV